MLQISLKLIEEPPKKHFFYLLLTIKTGPSKPYQQDYKLQILLILKNDLLTYFDLQKRSI